MTNPNWLCTVSTLDYVPKALALFRSLKRYDPAAQFLVVVTNASSKSDFDQFDISKVPGLILSTLHNFEENDEVQLLARRYSPSSDAFRWSIKPQIMLYLHNFLEAQKVIFLDNDIWFCNPFDFIWDQLENSSILLSPHWRVSDPTIDAPWFETNFRDGIFNGGFVGTNFKNLNPLKWWARACAYKCEINYESGLYVDQKYLDFLPTHFPNVNFLSHRGCNVAYWNFHECKRSNENLNGQIQVLINQKYPVIFIHFTKDLIKSIKQGKDPLLKNHLAQYEADLAHFGNDLSAWDQNHLTNIRPVR